ncbi:hypothetical protein [uncultured Sphingomonas sp.]|uniref:hypothetical protein n=1 Tax=uncultured Sphingomonas sp. TaxID=158754 RepID=UPI0035CB1AB6
MSEETENLTIRLLQEMRAQIERTNMRIEEMTDQITDLVQRIDGNTLVFNLVAGVVHDHEDRIVTLEGGRS